MLNQVQYHQAFVENKTNEEAGGFQGELSKIVTMRMFYLWPKSRHLGSFGGFSTIRNS